MTMNHSTLRWSTMSISSSRGGSTPCCQRRRVSSPRVGRHCWSWSWCPPSHDQEGWRCPGPVQSSSWSRCLGSAMGSHLPSLSMSLLILNKTSFCWCWDILYLLHVTAGGHMAGCVGQHTDTRALILWEIQPIMVTVIGNGKISNCTNHFTA